VKYNFKITGFGDYLPSKVETSEEISKKINKSEDWIISRTGIKSRRVSEIDVDEMGAIAAREAIGDKKKTRFNYKCIRSAKANYTRYICIYSKRIRL